MDKSTRLFLISGFISLFIFIFFISIFIYFGHFSLKSKSYALQKKNYVSISLESIGSKKEAVKKDITLPTPKKEVIKEKTEEKVESKDVDVDDLFSDVWTKKVDVKKPKKIIDSKRLSQISKRIPSKKVTKVKSIDISKVETQNRAKSSGGNEVNKYLATIQAIIYKHSGKAPQKDAVGSVVLALIELNPFGKLIDFRILRYSGNESFDRECDKIKARLENVLFPQNPDGKNFSHKIKIIAKDKN